MTDNGFYNDFDRECGFPVPPAPEEFRTPFQIGRDRIIHTSAFRRLQGKTQVFFSGEYDFYRTRLTHSIEVAQIGRSLCGFLNERSDLLKEGFSIDADLVEAACLAHDLGHPPFGHTGEHVLNERMAEWGGFEGNAQTLRLLTEIIFSGGTRGMNPSRALLDSILKYKTTRSQMPGGGPPKNHFVYDGQENYLHFVVGKSGFPKEITPGKGRNGFRSIECQIMDWADDTAYSLNDIADGIHAGFINAPKLEAWAATVELDPTEEEHIKALIDAITRDRVESRIGKKVGAFISAVTLVPASGFLSDQTHRHSFALEIDPAMRAESELYKRISVDLVFRSPQLRQLDFKSEFLLGRLFEVFVDHATTRGDRGLRLLPESLQATLEIAGDDEAARVRRVCDYLASLTDAAAMRTYKRLFYPGEGSIMDLV